MPHSRIRVMQPEEKARLSAAYQQRFTELSAMLFRFDPVGLNVEENDDEYEPEARTILPRLVACHSAADVQRVVREEFAEWFTPDIAKRIPEAEALAEAIWRWWDEGARASLRPDAA